LGLGWFDICEYSKCWTYGCNGKESRRCEIYEKFHKSSIFGLSIYYIMLYQLIAEETHKNEKFQKLYLNYILNKNDLLSSPFFERYKILDYSRGKLS